MDFNPIQQTLLPNTNTHTSYYEENGHSVKVIEYMLSSMSNELLTKFPDNSAFDFDYTQSSIWSPLLPHPSNPSSPAPELKRKLSYDEVDDGEMMVLKKFKQNGEGKISGSCLFSCFKFGKNCGFSTKKKVVVMKRRRSSFRGFDHLGSGSSSVVVDQVCSSPFRTKMKQGWKKVLKAASKQFKKTIKKKDSGAHLKLSSNDHSQFTYYY
uniref:uncharacterized protein LOC122608493 n=1 Tax=Erigeron canadensis TaxID=72917 RepID=UPI001CB9AC6F|nr:uncharacterized protein LOC122608493 [Erigeron canadensis]